MNVPENTRRATARAKTSAARIWPAPRTRKCQVRHAGWFPLGSLISAGGGVGKQVRQWSERRSSRGAKPPCVHAAGTAHAWYRVRQNSRFSCTAEERTGELLDCLSPKWIVQVTGENLSDKDISMNNHRNCVAEIISNPVIVLLDIFKQSNKGTIQTSQQTNPLPTPLLQNT